MDHQHHPHNAADEHPGGEHEHGPDERQPAISTTDAAATTLPVVRQAGGRPAGLLLVDDDDQQTDHSGKAVPPVSTAGLPYRYKVRLTGRNAYAMTADELLSLFVPDYPPDPPTAAGRHDVELERVRSRGRHCLGVMVDHVATAMYAGTLTPAEEQLLQRSAELDETGPITAAHCQRWTHPDVAMLLMGDLYAREYDRYTPPAGNVVFLFPGTAERYLAGLAELGLLALSENPAWIAGPLVEVSAQ